MLGTFLICNHCQQKCGSFDPVIDDEKIREAAKILNWVCLDDDCDFCNQCVSVYGLEKLVREARKGGV